MKKLVACLVFVGLLGVNGFAQQKNALEQTKSVDAAVLQAKREQSKKVTELSNALAKELLATRAELAALKTHDKQKIVNALAGIRNAYMDLNRASKSAAVLWAETVNAPTRTGWDRELVKPLDLLKANFPYEAYGRSTSYEEFEEFEAALRNHLSNVKQTSADVRNVFNALGDFRVYVASQKTMNVSHAMQVLINLVDAYEDVKTPEGKTAVAALNDEINRPIAAGWGGNVVIGQFAKDHACEVFGDTGEKMEAFAAHLN